MGLLEFHVVTVQPAWRDAGCGACRGVDLGLRRAPAWPAWFNVRFAPTATELLRGSGMTQWAISCTIEGSRSAAFFVELLYSDYRLAALGIHSKVHVPLGKHQPSTFGKTIVDHIDV